MRARIAASVALAAALAAILAGCNFITPQATLYPYEPSDGISTKVGEVDVLNAMVISDNGIEGNLVFHAINNSDEDVELAIQYDVAGTKTDLTVDLPAGQTTDIGYGDDGQLFLNGILARPGSLLDIYFQYGDEPGRQIQVPVLDGSLPQYTELIPTQTPTPTPTPTPTSTPTPAETPAP